MDPVATDPQPTLTPYLLAILRHMVTVWGGGMVAAGYLSNDQLSQVAGAVAALAMVGFSMWQKRKQHTLVKAQTAVIEQLSDKVASVSR